MAKPQLTPVPDRSTGDVRPSYVPVSDLKGGLKRNVLACIRFGRDASPSTDPRDFTLPLAAAGGFGLPDAGPLAEVWAGDRPADVDRDDGFGYAHNGEVLFGSLQVLEIELEDVAAATFRAFARLCAFLERQGYPHLLRCWNFLHDINEGAQDRERYRQFCLGRYQALVSQSAPVAKLSAATAIGTHVPGLLIYFLAGRKPGIQLENPRQVPAFRYPRQYGPRSPSFARATFASIGGAGRLMVSGTASVVGHATRHPHALEPQLEETLANVRALLAHAGERALEGGGWTPELLRLYLRDPADAAAVRAPLRAEFGDQVPTLFLEGDICRADLRLEIEGQFRPAAAPAPG